MLMEHLEICILNFIISRKLRTNWIKTFYTLYFQVLQYTVGTKGDWDFWIYYLVKKHDGTDI